MEGKNNFSNSNKPPKRKTLAEHTDELLSTADQIGAERESIAGDPEQESRAEKGAIQDYVGEKPEVSSKDELLLQDELEPELPFGQVEERPTDFSQTYTRGETKSKLETLLKPLREKEEKQAPLPATALDVTATPMDSTELERLRSLESPAETITPHPEQASRERAERFYETDAYKRREERAEKFAEKYGIAEKRTAMLKAEEEYKNAVRDHKSRGIQGFFLKISPEFKNNYDDATHEWRKAVFAAVDKKPEATDETSPEYKKQLAAITKEKHIATVISYRDTVMRHEEMLQRAALEANENRSDSALERVLAKGRSGAITAGRAYLAATGLLGKGIVAGVNKAQTLKGKEKLSDEQVKKIMKASRIVSTAALSTVAFGGLGGAGVGLSFLWRAARGTLGVSAGSALGVFSGKLYRETAGEKRRLLAREGKRDQSLETQDVDFERDLYKRGRYETIESQKRLAQIFGALVGGGGTSVLTGMVAHEMFAPHEAPSATMIQDSKLEGSNTTSHTPTGVHETASRNATSPTDTSASARPESAAIQESVFKGEGADRLIHDIRAQLASHPEIQGKFPRFHERLMQGPDHVIAKALGLNHQEGGIMIHPEDKLFIDDQGRLQFTHHLTGKTDLLVDEHGEIHELKGHVAHHAMSAAHASPERIAHQEIVLQKPFDPQADHSAVAEANSQEYAREQATGAVTPDAVHTGVIANPEIPYHPVGAEHVGSDSMSPHAPDHVTSESASATLDPSTLDRTYPRPYLTQEGHVTVFGGSPSQQREFAIAYAQLHPGEPVRFTVPRHGFLGTIRQHTEQVVADKDGTVKIMKSSIEGKRLEDINPSRFTTILTK